MKDLTVDYYLFYKENPIYFVMTTFDQGWSFVPEKTFLDKQIGNNCLPYSRKSNFVSLNCTSFIEVQSHIYFA